MRDWFEEVWFVLCRSGKMQLALLLGVVFFVGFQLLGSSVVSGLELHGPAAPVADSVRERLGSRVDKLAYIALVSFLVVAYRAYRKDRRRLLGL